jgi:effector-binding domain-containing protein
MKTQLAGTDGTVGAVYSWEGNDDVGKGEQTITKIEQMKRVDVKLHFLEPFESEAHAYITLADDPNGVKVTWAFEGNTPRPWNVFGLFMNMEKAVGEDFSKGLAKLKALAEKEAAAAPAYDIIETTVSARTFLGMRKEVTFDQISSMFNDNLPKIFADVTKAGMQPEGAPVGLYFKWDPQAMKTDMAAAIPYSARKKVGSWQTFEVKGGKALVIDYYGAYEKTENAHYAMDTYIADKKYKALAPVMEEYITDPTTEPDTAKWLTRITYFVE